MERLLVSVSFLLSLLLGSTVIVYTFPSLSSNDLTKLVSGVFGGLDNLDGLLLAFNQE